jgi:branched-chain amino acid transport system permease protein
LRGDYLAIVTLGFGEIIRVLILSDWLKPIFGGPQGITEVDDVPALGADTNDPRVLYYLIIVFALIAYFIATRLKDSRVGRAWAAMREDEDIAEGMGVSVIKYKLLAFAMGAAVGCLGGAFFPAKLGVANPGSFTLIVSINVLAVVVLGGIGSIPGVVVGSAILVGLPELLREFGEYRLHIYGAILIAIMILKPEGLIPDKRRALELHAKETHEATGVLTPAAAEGIQ